MKTKYKLKKKSYEYEIVVKKIIYKIERLSVPIGKQGSIVYKVKSGSYTLSIKLCTMKNFRHQNCYCFFNKTALMMYF